MKTAKVLLRVIGAVAVILAGLGFWYNASSLSADFSSVVQELGIPHFYAAYYTMSAICVACYTLLLFCGVQFLRLRTGVFWLFVGVLLFEVLYFFSLPVLCLFSGIGRSVGAAFGVANGGLVFQGFLVFPIWAPLLARWAGRRIGESREPPGAQESSDHPVHPTSAHWGWASRHGLWLAVALAGCAAYVPVRLLASKLNVPLTGATDDFYYRGATFLWPAYVLLLVLSVVFAGSLLRVHVVLRALSVFVLVAWLDLSSHVDSALALSDSGRTGLDTSVGYDNLTSLSVSLCQYSLLLGFLVAEALAFAIKNRTGAFQRQVPATEARSWRWLLSNHVLVAGLGAPLYGFMMGSLLSFGLFDQPPSFDNVGGWLIFHATLALGFGIGTWAGMRSVRRNVFTRDARFLRRLCLVAFCGLTLPWLVVDLLVEASVAASIAPTIAFYAAIAVAFYTLTGRALAGRQAPSGSE